MRRISFIFIFFLISVFLFSGCGYYHTVKQGDTIYSLSKEYGVPQDEIMEENDINDPTRLQIGTRLKIPRSGKSTGKTKTKTKTSNNSTSAAVDKIRNKNTPTPVRAIKAKIKFIWPVKGVVVSYFGKSSNGRINDGLDIGAPLGSPIVASADGEVILASDKFPAYGNMVVVKHKYNFVTVYAYNSENLVSKGDLVTKGQVIAKVGSSGRATTPTSHFEIRIIKNPVNPMEYLPSR